MRTRDPRTPLDVKYLETVFVLRRMCLPDQPLIRSHNLREGRRTPILNADGPITHNVRANP